MPTRPRVRRLVWSRLWKVLLAIAVIWTIHDLVQIRKALGYEAAQEPAPFGHQKVFIASTMWNNEIILRSHWAQAVAELAKEIGHDNVFVSIYASHAFDDTEDALRTFDTHLESYGVRRKIVLDERTHRDETDSPPAETGWIQMPETKAYMENRTHMFTLEKGSWQPRRISYLARMRNAAMQPLYELQEAGERFDKVLWLNDVVFETNDVRRLLSTRGGDFAAACALDFEHPPATYDTFALRDAEGRAPIMNTWPFCASAASRDALKLSQPMPVTSCWNGMVAFDAAPFYDDGKGGQLAFRGVADGLAALHSEASECCLIHADNPLSRTKGVWINPNVRVAYGGPAYDETRGTAWPTGSSIVLGLWQNRIKRWLGIFKLQDRTTNNRLAGWEQKDDRNEEAGSFCMVDEMQILLFNGWGHA